MNNLFAYAALANAALDHAERQRDALADLLREVVQECDQPSGCDWCGHNWTPPHRDNCLVERASTLLATIEGEARP